MWDVKDCKETEWHMLVIHASRIVFVLTKSRFPFKRNRLRLSALRKRKPQETQALALASCQSWLPLLWPSVPIGWRLRLLRELANASACVSYGFRLRNARNANDCVWMETIASCVLLSDSESLGLHWNSRAAVWQRPSWCSRCLQQVSHCGRPDIRRCIYFWWNCSDSVQTPSVWWPTDAVEHDCNGQSHGSWYDYSITLCVVGRACERSGPKKRRAGVERSGHNLLKPTIDWLLVTTSLKRINAYVDPTKTEWLLQF